jgi:hypothetical protein
VTATRVLSPHAAYGCRERGACCTAGWPIPIEASALQRAERAIAAGNIAVPASGRPIFVRPIDAPPETPALLGTHDEGCVFHARSGVNRCSLHRALGHAALPLACRQFPRVSLTDPRGVSITLSHYCPTAADLLAAGGPITIVEGAPGFPSHGEYVGLDARDALPPALRPEMLMDWESWWHWERSALGLLDGSDDAADAMERLRTVVEDVRVWTPAEGALPERLDAAFDAAHRSRVSAARRARTSRDARMDDLLGAIPDDFRDAARAALRRTGPPQAARTQVAFLAAHAFASWTAHLGGGLRTWLESLETAQALLAAGVSPGDADLLLRHLADPHALARVWASAEST